MVITLSYLLQESCSASHLKIKGNNPKAKAHCFRITFLEIKAFTFPIFEFSDFFMFFDVLKLWEASWDDPWKFRTSKNMILNGLELAGASKTHKKNGKLKKWKSKCFYFKESVLKAIRFHFPMHSSRF